MFLLIFLFCLFFFFSSRRRHTRYIGDWSSDVCSSDLEGKSAKQHNLPFKLDGQTAKLSLEVIPIKGPVKGETFFIVLFEEQARGAVPPKRRREDQPVFVPTSPRRELERMRQELEASRKHLRTLN